MCLLIFAFQSSKRQIAYHIAFVIQLSNVFIEFIHNFNGCELMNKLVIMAFLVSLNYEMDRIKKFINKLRESLQKIEVGVFFY
jgi:hypothetical protein